MTIVQEELGDPGFAAEGIGHHGLGSIVGYTESAARREEEATEAFRPGRACSASPSKHHPGQHPPNRNGEQVAHWVLELVVSP